MNIILGLLLIFVLFSIFRVVEVYKDLPVTEEDWYKCSSKFHMDILDILDRLLPCLDQSDLTYWSHAGTLLGQIRHSQIIPWDHDIDLVIHQECTDQEMDTMIDRLRNSLYEVGLACSPSPFGWWVFNRNLKNLAVIDLYRFKTNEAGQVKGNWLNQYMWGSEWYNESEIFPLVERPFNHLQLKGPRDADVFLTRRYNPDYMTKKKVFSYPGFLENPYHLLAFKIKELEMGGSYDVLE